MISRQDYHSLYLIYSVEKGRYQVDFSAFLNILKRRPYCVQYRSKENSYLFDCHLAKQLKRLCLRHRVPLIINDSLKLARRIGADGIHLGQQDGRLLHIKPKLCWRTQQMPQKSFKIKSSPIIGISCYNSLPLAIRAKNEGADYVAFGAVFHSPTKPDKAPVSFAKVRQAQALSLPIVVIGGINPSNLAIVKRTQAQAYAMISGINQIKL